MIKVVLLIFFVDFVLLGEEIKDVEKGGVDYIYIDVMDGYFVFNIIIGLFIVEVVCLVIDLLLDVYFMIENLDCYILVFVKVGVDIFFVYVEVCLYFYWII